MGIEITKGVPFKSFKRRIPISQIILHESVTSSRAKAVSVLKRRGLGVHLIVGLDGSVTQHVPMGRYALHAAGHNKQSVAIEVINRYYGARAGAGAEVIGAVWVHKGRYIFPPAVQLEAVWCAVRWVTNEVDIPRDFPGLQEAGFMWGRIKNTQQPGIQAHHRSAHADGLVPEFYCLLRRQGFGATKSYDLTKVTAVSVPSRRITPVPEAGEEEAS